MSLLTYSDRWVFLHPSALLWGSYKADPRTVQNVLGQSRYNVLRRPSAALSLRVAAIHVWPVQTEEEIYKTPRVISDRCPLTGDGPEQGFRTKTENAWTLTTAPSPPAV